MLLLTRYVNDLDLVYRFCFVFTRIYVLHILTLTSAPLNLLSRLIVVSMQCLARELPSEASGEKYQSCSGYICLFLFLSLTSPNLILYQTFPGNPIRRSQIWHASFYAHGICLTHRNG